MSSGLHTWLYAKIRERYHEDGDALIKQSSKHADQQMAWLLDQLRQRGSTDLTDEYQRQYNALARGRWRNGKVEAIARAEQALARAKRPAQQEVLRKELAKLQQSLEKHDAKWCTS